MKFAARSVAAVSILATLTPLAMSQNNTVIDLANVISPYSGSTEFNANEIEVGGYAEGPEQGFTAILLPGERIRIGQSSNNFDSVHTLRHSGSYPGDVEVAHEDEPDLEFFEFDNTETEPITVYFVVDGYDSDESGAFDLEWVIALTPATNPVIDLANEISPYTGSTSGNSNDVELDCSDGSPEQGFAYYNLLPNERITIGQTSNSFDSTHSLGYGGDYPGGAEWFCGDDPDTADVVFVNREAEAVTVYFVVEGYDNEEHGTFTLEWAIDTLASCDASAVLANAAGLGDCSAELGGGGASCTNAAEVPYVCTASTCDDGSLTVGFCSATCDASELLPGAADIGDCSDAILDAASCRNTPGAGAEFCTPSTCSDGVLAAGLCGDSYVMTDDTIHEAVDLWTSNEDGFDIYGHISTWNTAAVTIMDTLFNSKRNFNDDISGWNVARVNSMYRMFKYAEAFNGDISGWNVGSVTTMKEMFYVAEAFNATSLRWDVSSVTTMEAMFANTANFNGDISQWNVANVVNLRATFQYTKVFNADISQWDVSKVRNMNSAFNGALAFDAAHVNLWDVSKVADFGNGFNNQDMPFCGAAWLANPVMQDFAESNSKLALAEESCYCRPGEFFSEDECFPCPEGEYSSGGYTELCSSCHELDSDYFCSSQGVRLDCPSRDGLACVRGGIVCHAADCRPCGTASRSLLFGKLALPCC